VLIEHILDNGIVGRIAHHKRRRPARDPLHPLGGRRVRAREIIQQHDLVAGIEKGDRRVGADVSGTAGEEYTHAPQPTQPVRAAHAPATPSLPPDSSR
jgi:hypothetical protein